jgi:hypothetical protein
VTVHPSLTADESFTRTTITQDASNAWPPEARVIQHILAGPLAERVRGRLTAGEDDKVTLTETTRYGGYFEWTQDARGLEVTSARDFEDVEVMMVGLGDGESGMRDYLVRNRNGSYTWEHSSGTPNPREDAAAEFEGLSAAWVQQRERSQKVAALSIRASMPEEADTLVFEWSDQGPHFTLDGATRNGENVDVSDGEGWLVAPYEDISFASSNISDPTAAGLTALGGGRFAMTRDTLAVSAAERARRRTAAADAEVAAAAASAGEKWDAEAAAEYARAVAELTPVID